MFNLLSGSMDKGSFVRIIVFLLAWLNQYLVSQGLHPLPFVDETSVAGFITFVVSVWTLVKDNKVKSQG